MSRREPAPALAGLAAAALVLLIATSLGWQPAAVAAGVAVAALAVWFARQPGRAPARPQAPVASRYRPLTPVDRLATSLSWALDSDRGPRYGLRPMLREVTRPVLADRGLRLDRDDQRAARLLGADNWELLTGTDERASVDPDRLDRFITRLEELTP